MSIKDFWQEAPQTQQHISKAVREANLEQEAEEKHMLVLNGKLIQPEDYPCTCELLDPEQCFQEGRDFPDNEWSKLSVEIFLKAQEEETCPCPCHRYYEPY